MELILIESQMGLQPLVNLAFLSKNNITVQETFEKFRVNFCVANTGDLTGIL